MTNSPLYESKDAKRVIASAMRDARAKLSAQHVAGIFEEGDPNHPKYNNGINYVTGMPVSLFGYETRAFMARQYHATNVA